MSMRDKIEHAIQNQPCTVKELKQKFGGERGADRKVMEALDELVREAVVCQRQGAVSYTHLSYSLFQLLQVIRIRVRKSLVKILDHGIQIGQVDRLLFHLFVPLAYGHRHFALTHICLLYTSRCV